MEAPALTESRCSLPLPGAPHPTHPPDPLTRTRRWKPLLLQNCRNCKRINASVQKGDAEFMRWPPQSPWATSGCERCPFIQRQRSPPGPRGRSGGGPLSALRAGAGRRHLGAAGALGGGSRPTPPPPRLRGGLAPTPAFCFPSFLPLPLPLPFLPGPFRLSRPFPPSPLPLFLPSLRSPPFPPPAPQPSGKVKRKSFRRIFVKSALIRGITSRIKGGRDPPAPSVKITYQGF